MATKTMWNFSQISLEAKAGRIGLSLDAWPQGSDLLVKIYGGASHIGAVALATYQNGAQNLSLPGHKDGIVASEIAARLSASLQCAVAVACGIHYDKITAVEITEVVKLANGLAGTLVTLIKKDVKCR